MFNPFRFQSPIRRFPFAVGLLWSFTATSAFSTVLINEADPQNRGEQASGAVDGDFIELRATGEETSLAGYFLVPFDGIDAKSYGSYDLSGFPVASNKLVLIGGYGVANPDIVIHRTAAPRDPFEPGPDALILFRDHINPGTMVTDLRQEDIIDGIVYRQTATALPPGGLPAQLQNTILRSGHLAQNEGANLLVNFSGALIDSFGRNSASPGNPRETMSYQVGAPSPGQANNPLQPRLKLELFSPASSPVTAKVSLSEGSDGDVIQARLTRYAVLPAPAPATGAPLEVTLINQDISEIRLQASQDSGSEISKVTIPAGASSVDFYITPKGDGWKDGDVNAYLSASADGFSPGAAKVTVRDAATDAAPKLIITEVHGVPFGDANGDGSTSVDDQFVEILNNTDDLIDLDGYRLLVGGVERHVFAYGDQLLPHSAVVVFGKVAEEKIGTTEDYGTALVLKASSDGLGINRHGDVISLRSPGDTTDSERAGYVYWPYIGGSNTVIPAGFVAQTIGHKYFPESKGLLYSPGLKSDGEPYRTITARPSFVFSHSTVAALMPSSVETLKVQLPAQWPHATPLKIQLKNLHGAVASLSEGNLRTSVAFEQTQSPGLPLEHSKSLTPDEPAEAKFEVVRATGHLNGTVSEAFLVVATGKNLTFSSTADQVLESAGDSAAAFTVKLTGALTAPMSLSIVSGSGLSLSPGTVTIPAGKEEWTVALSAADVESPGPVTVRGVAEAPDSRNFETTLTLVEDVAPLVFINEFDPAPPAGYTKFVELFVPAAGAAGTTVSLDPYTLAVFDGETGDLIKAIHLEADAATDTAGFFVVSDSGGTFASPSFSPADGLSLPVIGGVLALFKAPAITELSGDHLLDAVAWGTVSNQDLLRTLLPLVTSPAEGGSVNMGEEPVAAIPAEHLLKTHGRNGEPKAADLRKSASWDVQSFPTPGYANGGSLFKAWLAQIVGKDATAEGDKDGDGYSNLVEFVYESSPNPPVDGAPALETPPVPLLVTRDNDQLKLDLAAVSSLAVSDPEHLKFELQTSSSLTPDSWVAVPWAEGKAPGVDPVTAAVIPLPAPTDSLIRSFYRIKIIYTP